MRGLGMGRVKGERLKNVLVLFCVKNKLGSFFLSGGWFFWGVLVGSHEPIFAYFCL